MLCAWGRLLLRKKWVQFVWKSTETIHFLFCNFFQHPVGLSIAYSKSYSETNETAREVGEACDYGNLVLSFYQFHWICKRFNPCISDKIWIKVSSYSSSGFDELIFSNKELFMISQRSISWPFPRVKYNFSFIVVLYFLYHFVLWSFILCSIKIWKDLLFLLFNPIILYCY